MISLLNCYYTAPDIKRLLIAPYASFSGYNLENDFTEVIAEFRGFPQWYEFDLENYDWSEVANRIIYNQQFSAVIVQETPIVRNLLRELRDSQVVVLFQDKNDNYLFFGENGTIFNFDVKINAGENRVAINFQSVGDVPARFVDTDYADSIVPVCVECGCDDFITEDVIGNTRTLLSVWECVVL